MESKEYIGSIMCGRMGEKENLVGGNQGTGSLIIAHWVEMIQTDADKLHENFESLL